jgi:predicted transcriptional regulator
MVMESKLSNEHTSFEDVFASKGRTKIIKILALKKETNISNIVQLSGLNHASVKTHLRFLVAAGILQKKSFGRILVYRFKDENIKANAIKNLIEFWEENA